MTTFLKSACLLLVFALCFDPAIASEGSPPFTPPSSRGNTKEKTKEKAKVAAKEESPEKAKEEKLPEKEKDPEEKPKPAAEPEPTPEPSPEPTPEPTATPVPAPVLEEKKEEIPVKAPSEIQTVTDLPNTNPVKKAEPPPLKGFNDFPEKVQELVSAAFYLHDRNLSYKYGAANPSEGGMDCSGTINYLLREHGWKSVPRQADAFYRWVWQSGQFVAVNGTTFDSYEWEKLKPGDLLFWTGTYAVSKDRDPAISHVMMYLGTDAKSGRRIMFGASEGRRYLDKSRSGVGLFDFNLPTMNKTEGGRQPRFVGYGRVPDPAETKSSKVTKQ